MWQSSHIWRYLLCPTEALSSPDEASSVLYISLFFIFSSLRPLLPEQYPDNPLLPLNMLPWIKGKFLNLGGQQRKIQILNSGPMFLKVCSLEYRFWDMSHEKKEFLWPNKFGKYCILFPYPPFLEDSLFIVAHYWFWGVLQHGWKVILRPNNFV